MGDEGRGTTIATVQLKEITGVLILCLHAFWICMNGVIYQQIEGGGYITYQFLNNNKL